MTVVGVGELIFKTKNISTNPGESNLRHVSKHEVLNLVPDSFHSLELM